MCGDRVSWNTVLSVFLLAENAPFSGASGEGGVLGELSDKNLNKIVKLLTI